MSEPSEGASRSLPEQRGDFMLLPPLVPTFGSPIHIQQTPASFLVTRRRFAVSEPDMAHAIDTELIGRVPARARRQLRFRAQDLEHLEFSQSHDEDVDALEAATESAPALVKRRLATPATRPPRPRATLPSRSDVRRSVSGATSPRSGPPGNGRPSAERRRLDAPAADGITQGEIVQGEIVSDRFYAPPMPPSTFPGVGESSAVIRRRGGGPAAPTMPDAFAERASEQPNSDPSSSETPQLDEVKVTPSNAAPEPMPVPPATLQDVSPAPSSSQPPIRARRSRGRIHEPVVPEPEEDLPPAVRRMLEELDADQSTTPVETPAVAERVADISPTADSRSAISEGLVHPSHGAVITSDSNVETPVSRTGPSRSQSDDAAPSASAIPSVDMPQSGNSGPGAGDPLTHRTRPEQQDAPAFGSLSETTPSATTPTSQPTRADTEGAAKVSRSEDSPSVPLISSRYSRGEGGRSASAVSEGDASAFSGGGVAPASELDHVGASLAPDQSVEDLEITSPVSHRRGSVDGQPTPTSLTSTTLGTNLSATSASAPREASSASNVAGAPGESVHRTALVGQAPQLSQRPVLSGRTGIQRRARSRPAAASSARSTTGEVSAGDTKQPRVAGARRVQVPEPVKQVLRGAVGEPPSHVTVHEGAHATEMAGAVNAEAFTRDGQIYLAGDASLESPRGQELLAHELTHVIQQGNQGGSMPGEHTDDGKAFEDAALKVEQAMATGSFETRRPTTSPRPPREPEQPELHHRHDSTSSQSRPTSRDDFADHASGSSRVNAITPAPQTSVADPGVQRRARDFTESALYQGLGHAANTVKDSLLSQVEQEIGGPPGPTKERDSRYKRLERQAAELYPYIRARLRSELVRDKERRGRIARDWG